MALSPSALSDLLEAIRAGEGTHTVREAMRLVLQEPIDLEASQAIHIAIHSDTIEPPGVCGRSPGVIPAAPARRNSAPTARTSTAAFVTLAS